MRKISLLFAFVCAALLVSACGGKGGPTGPTPPVATTPTAPVISGIEFRHAPTGLGSALGPLIEGPVTAGSKIQVVMNAAVNTDRVVTSSLKIFDPTGKIVAELTTPPSNVQAAFPAGITILFTPIKSGEYTPRAEISDAYGSAMREQPKLMVQ